MNITNTIANISHDSAVDWLEVAFCCCIELIRLVGF